MKELLRGILFAVCIAAFIGAFVYRMKTNPPPKPIYKDGYLIKTIDGHEYIINSGAFSSQLIHSESCPNPTHKEITK